MLYAASMSDEKKMSAREGASDPRRPYTAPSISKLGRIQDLTSAGTGGIMEHGMGTASTFSQA